MTEAIKVIIKRRNLFIAIQALFMIAGIVFALSRNNIYEVQTDLWPVRASSLKGSDIQNKLGGLSSLIVGFSGGVESPEVDYYISILKSRIFLTDVIKKGHLVHFLYNTRKSDYVAKNRKLPDENDAYPLLMKAITVTPQKNGLVELSYTGENPILGVHILTFMVNSLNEYLKVQRITMMKEDIAMLNEQIAQTQTSEIRIGLYSLVADKMREIALAQSRPSFAFNVIDPPYPPRGKVGPKRSLIVVGFAVVGFLSALICALLLEYRGKIKEVLSSA